MIKVSFSQLGLSFVYTITFASLYFVLFNLRLEPWAGAQRYWVNRELWGGPGYPIFVFIGGEWTESCHTLQYGSMYMYQLAQEHNGLLVNVEHRFYGASFPTNDTSVESLQYLTSDQALADLARLLQDLMAELETTDSKVVTIGGSYSGNLAAWFRLKYPSITTGSIASSGPVTADINFEEYMEVVDNSIVYYSGENCNAALQNAADELLLKNYSTLYNDFLTCQLIRGDDDMSILLSNLMGNIQGVVQYNNQSQPVNITGICKIMLDPSRSPYENFAYLSREVFLNTSAPRHDADNGGCDDVNYDNTIDYLSNTSLAAADGARQWTFQTCNQFGYYQTTDSANQPFHSWSLLNLEFYYEMCAAIFDGWSYDPQQNWTNTAYGATNIAATNIIFPTGSIDPWHVLGVVDTTVLPQSTEVPLLIEGTSHCADLRWPSETDPQSMKDARVQISGFVSDTVLDPVTPTCDCDDDGDDDTNGISETTIALATCLALTGFVALALFADKCCKLTPKREGLLDNEGMDNNYRSWK